jgi:uncharacterized membrane-anchored protein YjiN (DUF445 family)
VVDEQGGPPGSRDAGDDGSSKANQLRRMQRLATALLGAMLLLLAVSAAYQSHYSWLHWLRSFAEGGAVGALADWYAVTALFRYPLGLAIPHTAIIPSNKDRIGASLGNFVEQNFLTPENIIARLQQHDAAQALAEWLAERTNSLAVATAVADFVPAMLRGLEDRDVRDFFNHTVTPQLLSLNVSRLAGHALTVLTSAERHQALLDRALHGLERWLVAKEGLIRAKFSEASRYTPRLFDNFVVNKFVQGIVALLHEVAQNPNHELRDQFDQAVGDLIHQLMNSEDYRQKGADLLRALVERIQTEEYYRFLWDDVRQRLLADLASESSTIKQHIEGVLVAVGERLLDEPRVRQKLNAWWLDTIHRMGVRYRQQISKLITDVVRSWDAAEVSRKVEMEIGKDLQYIRINGTLVGGAVGLLLNAGIYVLGIGNTG